MKVVATVESRMASSRLPGKNALPILGKPMLARLVERLKKCRDVDVVCVATTDDPSDDSLTEMARGEGVEVFRGPMEDVLARVVRAAKAVEADVVAEITGDCPLIDPGVIDAVVRRYCKGGYDYVANILDRLTFPVGFDVQVYSAALLQEVSQLAHDPQDRVDVTPFIYHHPERYRLLNVQAPADLCRPQYRLCVDYPEDFKLVTVVYEALYAASPAFDARTIVRFLDGRPDVAKMNSRWHDLKDHPSSGARADQEVLSV